MDRRVPTSSADCLDFSSTCATAAIEARASPRKPMVWSEKRSSALRIFDVAWRSKASRASVADMPLPSSITCMEVFPASTTSTSMRLAPASTAFSTSSFITEAGRCITSPAAIWFATESGSSCIISLISLDFPLFVFPRFLSCASRCLRCAGAVPRGAGYASAPCLLSCCAIHRCRPC